VINATELIALPRITFVLVISFPLSNILLVTNLVARNWESLPNLKNIFSSKPSPCAIHRGKDGRLPP
jgi:hypothetical protein